MTEFLARFALYLGLAIGILAALTVVIAAAVFLDRAFGGAGVAVAALVVGCALLAAADTVGP